MAEAAAAPAKKAPKAKKPATAKPALPAYKVLIADAVKALAEKKGSSRKAILKYILANNKIESEIKAQTNVKLAVRKMVAAKTLLPVAKKGVVGVNCSFKLAEVKKVKKAKKPAAKKPAKKVKKAKKPAAKKAKKPVAAKKPAKKAVAKKPAAKKPAAKKTAAKKVAKKVAKK